MVPKLLTVMKMDVRLPYCASATSHMVGGGEQMDLQTHVKQVVGNVFIRSGQ